MRRLTVLTMLVALGLPALALAQAIPVPSQPVVFCGTQAAPLALGYQLSFDGGLLEPVTMTPAATAGPATTFCQTNLPSFTHSFTLPASRFAVGTHTVKVYPANTFGSNETSPVYSVEVGIGPGHFTTGAVGVLPAGGARRRVR